MGHKIKPEVCEGCKVPKGWGEELIIENNEMYCGKLLIFKEGCKFSMHYHLIKDETWYVNEGEFLYRWIDTETADVKQTILISLLVVILLLIFRKDLMLYCFDPRHAKTVGINVFFLHYLLLTCLSLAAVVGLQSVGIILVVAMLITPGATAYLLTDKFDNMTVISVLSAIISSLIGIYVSFWFDLETGGSIVLAQTFIFLFAFLFAPRYGIFKLKKLFAGYK